MNNTPILNISDQAEIAAALKANLATNPKFSDFDFDGSNINALINMLAYNTYINSFYRSMAFNESFRSSAILRTNVIARAAELEYVPKSFSSARAVVNITVSSNSVNRAAVIINKGTAFTARIDDQYYTFTTDDNITSTESYTSNNGSTVNFVSNNVALYEGIYQTDSYQYSAGRIFDIENAQIDTNSLTVNVIDTNGTSVTKYSKTNTSLGIKNDSNVYFLRANSRGLYQIEFGNGVLGNQPDDGSMVIVEYRISSGQLPNGARNFKTSQTIDGESNISVVTVEVATGGEVYESTDNIRFSAGKTFASQERGVSADDFASLLKRDFPSIADIIVYGGETLSPPKYRTIMVSAVINNIERIPQNTIDAYKRYLKSRSAIPFIVEFVDPSFVNIKLNVAVDVSRSNSLSDSSLKTLAIDQINKYVSDNVGVFNGSFHQSKILSAIDGAHPSIDGSSITVSLYKKLYAGDVRHGVSKFTFGNEISDIYSDPIKYNNQPSKIANVDDELYLFSLADPGTKIISTSIGTVDILTGNISMNQILLDNDISVFNMYANTKDNSIKSNNSNVLRLSTADILFYVNR